MYGRVAMPKGIPLLMIKDKLQLNQKVKNLIRLLNLSTTLLLNELRGGGGVFTQSGISIIFAVQYIDVMLRYILGT